MLLRKVPDFLTLSNLLCGCIGIWLCLSGEITAGARMIIFSAVFDFLDGMSARLIGVNNPHGKDLDSLADVVSFGVLPGFIAMQLIQGDADQLEGLIWLWGPESHTGLHYLSFAAFLIPLLSAYRLALFNHDTRQTDSFIGLATPANALFWCGLAEGICNNTWYLLANPLIIALLALIFSMLLLVPLPMFSFKFKSMSWNSNKITYIFLVCCIAIVGYLGLSGLSACISLYLVFSVLTLLNSPDKALTQK
jgi:CDP-diacylglycerol--serine O-phosphatidyltransferase